MVTRLQRVSFCAVTYLVGCGGKGEQDPSAGVATESAPASFVHLGTVEDLRQVTLPANRMIAVTPAGQAYLLPDDVDAVMPDSTSSSASIPDVISNQARVSNGTAQPLSLSSDDGIGTVRQALAYSPPFNPPDDRIAMTGASDDRRIVSFNGTAYCTGAYIGPRHIATAGHCVLVPGFNWFVPSVVVPGKQGECGRASWTCNDGLTDQPFGTKAVGFAIVPTAFFNNSGGDDSDYAVIILQDSQSWGSWLGMNSAAPPLPPTAVQHRGYPTPDTDPCAGSPGPHNSSIFSAPFDKQCGGFQYWQASNVSTNTATRSYTWLDTQPGQSGGPLISTDQVYGTLIGVEPSTNRSVFRRLDFSFYCNAIRQNPSSAFHHVCDP